MLAATPKIHIAFRFHANLYHSYRADTLDEKGLGKDIRIMTYCLDVLDDLNAKGIPVKGTWDIENYYSLQKNMPALCPDIVERIKARVQAGVDEVELMSYNNGIHSAHTLEEAEIAMSWAISNPDGSGLKDIFGRYAPIVRPQECMITPSLIKVMNDVGVEAISVYYSCIPFNGFSNFVPLLKPEERYNLLRYTAPGFEDSIKLIPAINPADAYENGGITKMARDLRKYQMQMENPVDMLIVLDMDADDDFWQGYVNTTLSFAAGMKTPLIKGGLNIFAKKLAKLPYVQFTTPGEYMATHDPVKTVCFGQDTADGSHDSYSPWSDKLENKKLFTAIERNRLDNEYAQALCADKRIAEQIAQNIPQRILPLSTTHFGLSTPVMCKPRLFEAFGMVEREREKSAAWLKAAVAETPLAPGDTVAVLPARYFRGDKQKRALVRCADEVNLCADGVEDGFYREVFGKKETVLLYKGTEHKIALKNGEFPVSQSIAYTEQSVDNGAIRLEIENDAVVPYYRGNKVLADDSFATKITYDGRVLRGETKAVYIDRRQPNYGTIVETGEVHIGDKQTAVYTKTYSLLGALPYFYADMEIRYPMTDDYGTSKGKVEALYRGYDTRWEEIVPLEIVPNLGADGDNPLRVHKHNFMGSLSHFDFDYYKFTPNANIDSSNNAVTCSFIATTCKEKGLLIAQSVAADYGFAFTCMRFERGENGDTLRLNPFGLYRGNQWKYNLTRSGLAMKFATKFASSYMSCAPTYRGGTQQFSLMFAPFDGDQVSDTLVNDAVAFSYPPYIVSDNADIRAIAFTDYNNYEPLAE